MALPAMPWVWINPLSQRSGSGPLIAQSPTPRARPPLGPTYADPAPHPPEHRLG